MGGGRECCDLGLILGGEGCCVTRSHVHVWGGGGREVL